MSLDIEKDISPEAICGENLTDEIEELEDNVENIFPQDLYDKTDDELERWEKVKEKAETLFEKTIDLQVLLAYVRAQVKLKELSGLEEGLSLLTTLIEKRWSSFHPQLSENPASLKKRLKPLNQLEGESFINSIKQIPLLEGGVTYRDVLIADKKIPPRLDKNQKFENAAAKQQATEVARTSVQSAIDKAIEGCKADTLKTTSERIDGVLKQLEQLEKHLKVGVAQFNQVPANLSGLKQVLSDCKNFVTQVLESKGVVIAQPVETIPVTQENLGTQAITPIVQQGAIGGINSRKDAERVLKQVADYFRKNEPSSPVPWLLDRAIRLIGKSFMDVLNDIAPNGTHEAKTIFGTKDDNN